MNAFLLLQTGDYFLLQTGDKMLLHEGVVGATSTGGGPVKRRNRLQQDDDEVTEIVKHMLNFLEP